MSKLKPIIARTPEEWPAPWVSLPYPCVNGIPYPGQTAGFLGARCEPLWLRPDPKARDFVCRFRARPPASTHTLAFPPRSQKALRPLLGREAALDPPEFQLMAARGWFRVRQYPGSAPTPGTRTRRCGGLGREP